MKRLEGLTYEPVFWNSRMGVLRACANYVGVKVSDAWLYGATGHAFVINTDEQGSPRGPEMWNWEMIANLGNNLGFTISGVRSFKTDPDFQQQQELAWENTRRAIDQGFPCFGYNLAIPAYYVINGYDEKGYYFDGEGTYQRLEVKPEVMAALTRFGDETYVTLEDEQLCQELRALGASLGHPVPGRLRMVNNGGVREILDYDNDAGFIIPGPGYTPWRKVGTVHIGLLEMLWVEPGIASTDRETVKEALEFALEFAQGRRKWTYTNYRAGLAAYDAWIAACKLESPDGFGLAVNGQNWSECRHYAALFLCEASARIGGEPGLLLGEAADTYQQIAQHLRTVAELIPFHGRRPEWLHDRQRMETVTDHLVAARKLEKQALAQLAGIVSRL